MESFSEFSPQAVKRGLITESIQKQAKKLASPVISDFLIAARRGFTTQVLQALKEGGPAKASSTDKHGRNCLQLAAIHGHFETVLGILQTGLVNIDGVNKRGLTALHDACSEGHTKIALLLLSMGGGVTVQTKDGWTCLMSTCSSGYLTLAKIVIAAGCDLNTHTKLGLTALHIAAWKGHTELVEMLLHGGCSPHTLSHSGKTALQLAMEEDRHECATVLTAATAKNSEDPVYRISSLEGQLRQCQNKLTESFREYESEITKQQLNSKELLEAMQKEHHFEVNQALKRIEDLERKISEIDKSAKETPTTTENTVPPPLQPKSPSRKRHSKKGDSSTPHTSNSELMDIVTSPPTKQQDTSGEKELLVYENPPKSASYSDLTTIVNDGGSAKSKDTKLPVTPQLSPANSKKSAEKRVGRRGSGERLTITALVAESLCNPGSMLAIRKELKSDSFTPKIQRKFPTRRASASPATLPSVSPVKGGGGGAENYNEKEVKPTFNNTKDVLKAYTGTNGTKI